MRNAALSAAIAFGVAILSVAGGAAPATQGSLVSLDAHGQSAGLCPLKHTDVKGEISGFVARVTVNQEFQNPYQEKIEAVYTFPLPADAAVDDMTMLVGARTIRAVIKTREEARATYEAAKTAGHVASLLDQERPNVFTQSVANIMPGENVKVTISYVEILKYEEGSYQFSFPMVVGPRYIPGTPTGQQGGGWSPDTDRVPDASRITPPVAPPGTRAGHDISIQMSVDAGVPIQNVQATTHEVSLTRPHANRAVVQLRDQTTVPNKDFILKYDVAGGQVEDALLVHRGQRGGFFTLILQPPARPAMQDLAPKELVFVLDTSGSMRGFPIEKAKEAMILALDGLYPQDTFNVITFSGYTETLFPDVVAATRENIQTAREFLSTLNASGGTEIMKAVKAALDPSDSQDHVRIVCFMTDGYVGNDMEVIGEVQKHPNARVFAFGIGTSVNHFLLDNMAKHGRGEVDYVSLKDDGSAAARRFHERVRRPLLTDVAIDWGGLPVSDVYPQRVPDLFAAKPVVLTGRFVGPASGTIHLRGKTAGGDFSRSIQANLPYAEPDHDALATLWARTRVADLMSQDFPGLQRNAPKPEVRDAITQLGLTYRLMTQFTSFVAVEEQTTTTGGQSKVVQVPVEMPEGVSYEGVFGQAGRLQQFAKLQVAQPCCVSQLPASMGTLPSNGPGSGGGIGSGSGGGVGPAGSAPGYAPGRAGGSAGATLYEQMGLSSKAGGFNRTDGAHLGTGDYEAAIKLRAKMRPSLVALILRGEGKATLVQDGSVAIQLWLTDASALAQLKQAGLEVTRVSGNVVVGKIALEKLAALAELTSIRFIAPYGHY